MVHYGRMPASSWCGVPGRGYTDDRTTAGKNREVLQPRGVNNCKSISLCHIFPQLELVTVGQFAPGIVLRTAVTVCTQLVGCCAASAIVKIKRVCRSQCDIVGIRHWNPGGWTDSTVCVNHLRQTTVYACSRRVVATNLYREPELFSSTK